MYKRKLALIATAFVLLACLYAFRLTSTGGDVAVAVNTSPAGTADAGNRPPPTIGPYGYDTWKAGRPGFVGLGETYVDPVFSTTVRRITNDYPNQSGSDIYSRNGWWNADGTRFMHRTSAGFVAIDPRSGAVVRRKIPSGRIAADASFDSVDPNAWYYYSGSELRKYDMTTGDSSVLKKFPGTLETLGASLDWMDRTGRYFLINYDIRRLTRAMARDDYFFQSDLAEGAATARRYRFERPWGVPVRYHDTQRFLEICQPDIIEFHLSYSDMERDPAAYLSGTYDLGFVVHAPELFAGSKLMDLATSDEGLRRYSLEQTQAVIDITRGIEEILSRRRNARRSSPISAASPWTSRCRRNGRRSATASSPPASLSSISTASN